MKRPVLAIEKGEKIFIPRKYRKIHNLCAIIYDQLTEIYKGENYKSLQYTTFEFKDDDIDVEVLKNEGLHVLDWLKVNNRNEEIEIILTKHIVLALTSDFINFIFEFLPFSMFHSFVAQPKNRHGVSFTIQAVNNLNMIAFITDNRFDFIKFINGI